MNYYKNAETGQIFAYEDSVAESEILQGLVPLTEAEIKQIFDRKSRDTLIGVEMFWVTSQLALVAEQLLMHEDGDSKAIATPESWREYRKKLRRWNETDSPDFPDKSKRPATPK